MRRILLLSCLSCLAGWACSSPASGTTAGAQQACGPAATDCIAGTATTSGFTVAPARMVAHLYRELPSVGATPLATVPVAADGSWVFGGVAAWEHYFVEVAADFGQPQSIGAVAGPLGVPASGTAPTVVTVKPVQLTVIEQATAGGAMQLQSALAYVFDPASGAPVQDATVTITVGGAPVAMPWGAVGGTQAYSVSFATSPAAQSTYAITTALPGAGAPSAWQLQAGSPSFVPSMSTPQDGATVPQGQPLAVTWPAQAAADEEIVELFTQQQSGWTPKYAPQHPDDADVTQETIPGSDVVAGPLLVQVLFASASCPASADGCVVSNEVAASQITAQ